MKKLTRYNGYLTNYFRNLLAIALIGANWRTLMSRSPLVSSEKFHFERSTREGRGTFEKISKIRWNCRKINRLKRSEGETTRRETGPGFCLQQRNRAVFHRLRTRNFESWILVSQRGEPTAEW